MSISAKQGVSVVYNVGGIWMPTNQKAFIDQGYKLNANIYSVINKISRTAAKAWWQLFDISKGEPTEILEHELLDLLERPNPAQSRFEFIEAAAGYRQLLGERFILKASPIDGINKGKTKEMYLLPPPAMTVKFTPLGIPIEYKWQSRDPFKNEQIIYSKLWNPGENRGLSPIHAGRRVVTQSNDTYLAGSMLLQNMGAQGFLTLDDKDVELSQPQIDDMEKRFAEKWAGPSNVMKWAILSQKFNWQQIGMKAADLGLADSQKMTLREICNLYGISSQLLNDPENTTYNNVREARKDLITNVVLPELEALTGEFNRGLVPEYEGKLELRIDKSVFPELKRDTTELVNALTLAWWLTPNRRLELMDEERNENPAMDEIYVPSSVLPIGADPFDEMEKIFKNASKTNGHLEYR